MITVEESKKYLAAGLCVLPAHATEKRPLISWKTYQKELPPADHLERLFPAPRVCVLCGKVSGNLELIDFDDCGSQYPAFMEKAEWMDDTLRKCFFERSPSGGFHIAYRVPEPVCGSQKLARTPDGQTLIETRGEAGLFLCAPSEGYEALSEIGLEEVGTITMEERDALLDIARTLDQYVEPAPMEDDAAPVDGLWGLPFSEPKTFPDQKPTGTSWDDFNRRADVREILLAAGWKPAPGGSDGNENWTRPGKTSGVSATLKEVDGTNFFHIFSSNALPFTAGKSYTPFQVFTELVHGGSHSAAAADLRRRGWGEKEEAFDFSAMVSKAKEKAPNALNIKIQDDDDEEDSAAPDGEVGKYVPPTIPEHLFNVPGLVEEITDYCAMYAPRPQRPFALATALAITSLACNQQYASPRGIRANVYLMAVGPTGSGKEFGRTVTKQLFDTLALPSLVRETYASLPGLQNDIRCRFSPRLWLMDEMGRTLQALNSKNSNASAKELWPGLLRLYTSANSSFKPTIKGDILIQQDAYSDIKLPFLSLLGTSTPEQLLTAMTWEVVSDGFLGRVMIFEAEPPAPGFVPSLTRSEAPPLPDGAVWVVNACVKFLRDFPQDPPATVCVPEDSKAFDCFEDLLRRQTKEQEKPGRFGALWARCEEQAEKLAVLWAYSYDYKNPVITEAAATWACELSEYLTRRRIEIAKDWIAESEFDAKQKEVIRFLKERGGSVSKRDVVRRFRSMTAKSRDEILTNLIETKIVRVKELGGVGRKKSLLVLNY